MLADSSVEVLLLTDLVMPEMSGRVLAAEAMVQHPGLRILFYVRIFGGDHCYPRGGWRTNRLSGEAFYGGATWYRCTHRAR
jgi:hypothetical protein